MKAKYSLRITSNKRMGYYLCNTARDEYRLQDIGGGCWMIGTRRRGSSDNWQYGRRQFDNPGNAYMHLCRVLFPAANAELLRVDCQAELLRVGLRADDIAALCDDPRGLSKAERRNVARQLQAAKKQAQSAAESVGIDKIKSGSQVASYDKGIKKWQGTKGKEVSRRLETWRILGDFEGG